MADPAPLEGLYRELRLAERRSRMAGDPQFFFPEDTHYCSDSFEWSPVASLSLDSLFVVH